ncbi:MAG: hypothetical protein AAGF60_06680 [Pseudomonadota bacterium]
MTLEGIGAALLALALGALASRGAARLARQLGVRNSGASLVCYGTFAVTVAAVLFAYAELAIAGFTPIGDIAQRLRSWLSIPGAT